MGPQLASRGREGQERWGNAACNFEADLPPACQGVELKVLQTFEATRSQLTQWGASCFRTLEKKHYRQVRVQRGGVRPRGPYSSRRR